MVIDQFQPSLSTTPNPTGGVVGVVLKDTADLTGGYDPQGTITFNLYGPSASTSCEDVADSCCGGPLVYGPDVVSVDGNDTYSTSAGFPTTATGTYYWTSYSGDTNNTSAGSGCGEESVVVTNPPPSNNGFVGFTKIVTGDLTNWAGGTFSFTLNCGGATQTFSIAFTAAGSKFEGYFPYPGGTSCTLTESAPSPGTGYSWATTYAPSQTVTVTNGNDSTITVTNTRKGVTPNVPTPTPTATPKPTPTGGVLGATGKPSLPPTSSVPGSGGSSDSNNVGLLLAGLLAVSLALVVSTRMRGRLLDRIDR